MSYSNIFLRDFRPVFLGILKAKSILPKQVALVIIDEEPDGEGIFEPVGVREVLEQLAEDLNFLTIYTERPAYFCEFAETMYEEMGLIATVFPKYAIRQRTGAGNIACTCEPCRRAGSKSVPLILDFEWEGGCDSKHMRPGSYYIPIHKRVWKKGENLDIIVPIGYNTVIVKGIQSKKNVPRRDRFEEAFYSEGK